MEVRTQDYDIPLPTCEAEIRAINAAKPAAVTALYIQHLLEEVLAHLPPVDIDPTETELHWIKRAVENRAIQSQYCPTKEQLADIFTKALAHNLFITIISNFMFYFKV
jgi:hypothetical protein